MNRILSIMALLVATLAATAVQAESSGSRYETTFSRDLPYRGGAVNIDHQFGGVNIRGGSGSEVSVRATIRSSDPAFGQQIRLTAEPSGTGVRIRTDYPEGRKRSGDFSYSVDLQVTVPATAPLRVRNRFGSVNASGIASNSEFVNGHGSIHLTDARGSHTIENTFGSIQVRNVAGDATIRNSHGSVRAEVIRGMADVTNRFGSVSLAEVDREAVVKNANGSVDVRDIRGDVNVSNSFGSISVQSIIGDLRVDGNHSRVSVRDVRGSAAVTTTFATADVQNVGGSVTITNNNGSVKTSQVRQNATVKTSFASVTVTDVAGAVDVQNQNGSISASRIGSASGCQPISLRTSFASLKLALPSNASYAVNFRTTFGRIISALPISTTSVGGETIIGSIGNGSCRLELVNNNGSITIERE